MHLVIIQLCHKAKPSVFGRFPRVQSIFSIGRPHDDTRINASNVSSFNWLLRSLFAQLCLEKPCSHLDVLAKPKLESVLSWSYRVEIASDIGMAKILSIIDFYFLFLKTNILLTCQIQNQNQIQNYSVSPQGIYSNGRDVLVIGPQSLKVTIWNGEDTIIRDSKMAKKMNSLSWGSWSSIWMCHSREWC